MVRSPVPYVSRFVLRAAREARLLFPPGTHKILSLLTAKANQKTRWRLACEDDKAAIIVWRGLISGRVGLFFVPF